jgi:hypothetical protein
MLRVDVLKSRDRVAGIDCISRVGEQEDAETHKIGNHFATEHRGKPPQRNTVLTPCTCEGICWRNPRPDKSYSKVLLRGTTLRYSTRLIVGERRGLPVCRPKN